MLILVSFKALLLALVVALRFDAILSLTTIFLSEGQSYARAALAYDARLAAACIFLTSMSVSLRSRWLFRLLQWTCSLVVLMGALDLYVFQTTWQRLSWDGVVTFGNELGAIWDFFFKNVSMREMWPVTALLCTTFLWVLIEPLLLWRIQPTHRLRIQHGLWLTPFLLALILVPVRLVDTSTLGTFKPLAVDTLTYQIAYSDPGPLTPSARDAIIARHKAEAANPPTAQCTTGLQHNKDVVLVILESLSAHHSLRIAGINDWTPQIDAIFTPGWSFNNFYANGFRTDLGLVSTLAGLDPLSLGVPGKWVFQNAPGTHALPARLKRLGYSTHFVSGSPLIFLDSDLWFPTLGFDHIYEPGPARGDVAKKNTFPTWSDRETYTRALTAMDSSIHPGLFVINTISSHIPYRNPETGENGEQAAIKYADDAFAGFYQQLVQRGFFDKGGLLLLTGDHHSMVPITAGEYQRYGASSPARVPLFVLGNDLPALPAINDGPFQQADLPASLAYWAGDHACFTQRQRNLFVPANHQSQRCIVHARGDNFRRLRAFCGSETADIAISPQGAQARTDTPSDDLRKAVDDIAARRAGLEPR